MCTSFIHYSIISIGFDLPCLLLMLFPLSLCVPNAAIQACENLNSNYCKCQDYFLQSSRILCCICIHLSKMLISPFCWPVIYHFYFGYPFFTRTVEIGCYIEYARYRINTWIQGSYYLLTNCHSTLECVAPGGRMTGT